MILGDKDFDFTKTRNKALSLVTAILVLSIVILALDILLYIQINIHQQQIPNILSIAADSLSIVLILFEWNCLYFFRNQFIKGLLYSTMFTYIFVFTTTIIQFSTKFSIQIKVEEVVDIVVASFIIVLGIYKSYYSHTYVVKGLDTLNNDLRSSILSQEDYETGLRNNLG